MSADVAHVALRLEVAARRLGDEEAQQDEDSPSNATRDVSRDLQARRPEVVRKRGEFAVAQRVREADHEALPHEL